MFARVAVFMFRPPTPGCGSVRGYHHLLFKRIGVEAEARFLRWHGPSQGLNQETYLGGAKYTFLHVKSKLSFSGKFLAGEGHITIPQSGVGTGNYFAYSPGLIAELKLSRRLSARADYEYQFWPSFKGVPVAGLTSGVGGITPNGFSIGASYAVFR